MLKATRKKEKNVREDLHINRGAIVRVIKPKMEMEDIFKIELSLYVIPQEQCETDEYEEQTKRMNKYINHTLKRYVLNNDNMFQTTSIVDISFNSANLRKGYNKSVQASMFVKSMHKFDYIRFRERIKNTIKPTIKMITDRFKEEGYVCHKKKQKINKKLKQSA